MTVELSSPAPGRSRQPAYVALTLMLAVALVGCSSKTPAQIAADELAKGLAATASHDEAGAVAHYQACVKADPTNKFCLYNLGVHAQRAGRLVEAENDYRLALAIDAAFPNAIYNLALLMRTEGDLRQAAQLLGTYVGLKPDDPAGHLYLGLVLRDTGDSAGAAVQFAEARRLNPQVVIPTPAPTASPTASPFPRPSA